MASWSDFLIEKARKYDLSRGEMELLITQFNEENINQNKTEPQWAENVGIKIGSYKKFKNKIIKKFTKSKMKPEACEFVSDGRDKFLELRDWLKTEYRNTLVEKSSDASSTKTVVIKPVESKNILACPYRGLFAFRPEDAPVFFGREKFTKALVAAVSQKPLVAVIGNSGIGKSSVVFAGLIPELNKLANWETITFRPNKSPLFQLANALLQWLEPEMDKLGRIGKCKKYAEQLKTRELILKDVLDVTLKESHSQQNLLIVVDQFEEIYTLSSEYEKQIFLEQLLDVVEEESQKQSYNVVVVMTLRADFYGLALADLRLGEELQKWKPENITEIEFIEASRQYQEQEDIERIKDLLNLSQKELQLKQQLSSLVIAVKAGVKLRNIKEPSQELKRNVIERLQQGSYEISEQNQFVGHQGEINGVAFSPDGLMIASASDDQNIKLWDLDGKLLKTFEGHIDEVWGVSFSADGQIIASASVDRTVKLWNVDGTLLRTLEGHTDQVWGVSFSPDGQIIASASADRTVRLWNLDGTLLRTLEGHTDRVWGVSFSPDGQIIASASFDRTVKLWNLDGTLLRTLEGHSSQVYGVSFSLDGQIIASASDDRTVRLWSFDGTLLRTLEGHTNQVNGVSSLLKILEGHTDQVNGVSFSPDSQIIASASFDRTVRLWKLDGTLLRTLEVN